MEVEYHKSFERDLRRVRDQNLLARVEAVLVEIHPGNFVAIQNVRGWILESLILISFGSICILGALLIRPKFEPAGAGKPDNPPVKL